MEYYQYLFENVDEEQNNILIAMLSDIGFDGFEEADHELKAFIKKDIDPQELHNVISLTGTSYLRSVIPEVNWNEKWEEGFEPVSILYPDTENIFVTIRADFHPAGHNAKHDIIITPKMSFGTGHHPTTSGMIECMSSVDFTDMVVIDFGTGTGVLAILAEKLGAASIIGIDNDDWSIRNAGENIIMNGCSKIKLVKSESLIDIPKADIILANINLNVIISNLEMLISLSKKNAIIILSGMLSEDKPVIVGALKKYPVEVLSIYEKNKWLVILLNPA